MAFLDWVDVHDNKADFVLIDLCAWDDPFLNLGENSFHGFRIQRLRSFSKGLESAGVCLLLGLGFAGGSSFSVSS